MSPAEKVAAAFAAVAHLRAFGGIGGARVSFGTKLSEAEATHFAEACGVKLERTVWLNVREAPYVIYAFHARVDDVEVTGQGDRRATLDDLTDGTNVRRSASLNDFEATKEQAAAEIARAA